MNEVVKHYTYILEVLGLVLCDSGVPRNFVRGGLKKLS